MLRWMYDEKNRKNITMLIDHIHAYRMLCHIGKHLIL